MHIALPAYHYQVRCFLILSIFSPLDVKSSISYLQVSPWATPPHLTPIYTSYREMKGTIELPVFEESPLPWALPFPCQAFLLAKLLKLKEQKPQHTVFVNHNRIAGLHLIFPHCLYHISQHSAVYICSHLQAKAIYQSTQKSLFKKRHHAGHKHPWHICTFFL